MQTRIFEDTGTEFGAFNEAEKWVTNLGFKTGSMQREAPIGIFGPDEETCKWRHLSEEDKKHLKGTITAIQGSFRVGNVQVVLKD